MTEIILSKEKCRKHVLAALVALLPLTAIFILHSCDIDDDRDECCERAVLHYRYVRQERDEYKEFVKDMRHFLFDKSGHFLYEISSNTSSPQKIVLKSMPVGKYSIITIGNSSTQNELLSKLVSSQSSMETFNLKIKKGISEIYSNTDELFWNSRTIELKKAARQDFYCDLSNIHCHLFVRVYWHVLPKYNGNYTMHIKNVATENTLTPSKADSLVIRDIGTGTSSTKNRVIHTFPSIQGKTKEHYITVPLYNLELQGEFITLRYANNRIPIFRLYFENKAVTKSIDLSNAFKEWGWKPDEHPEQIYRIEMEVFDDGKVIVNQWGNASVEDWQNGGVFDIKK